MNKFLIGLSIFGGVALVTGGTLLAVGISSGSSSNEYKEVKNTYTIDDSFDSFDIDTIVSNVTFVKSTEGNIVVCEEMEKLYSRVEVKGNSLKITQIDERPWFDRIYFWTFHPCKVTVYVTETNFNTILAKTNAGNINVPKDFSFTTMNIKTETGKIVSSANVSGAVNLSSDTGSITYSDAKCGSLTAECDTGAVRIKNMEIQSDIKADVDTGVLEITDTKCVNIDTKNSTGETKFIRTIASGTIKARASTGDIVFDKADADSLDIKTSTGSVEGTLLTPKTFIVDTDTGSKKYPKDTTGGRCVIETSTGSVNISIAG